MKNYRNELINYPYKGAENPMPRSARAAQFSPFAALTGFEELIDDSAVIPGQRREIDEDKAEYINECLQTILMSYPQKISVSITYFVPDKRKGGGNYETICGLVRQIDEGEMTVVFDDNRVVSIAEITDINF